MSLGDPTEINRVLYPQLEVYEALKGVDEFKEVHQKFYKNQGFIAVEELLSSKEINTAIEAIMEHIFSEDTKVKVQFVKKKNEIQNDEERELAVRKLSAFVDYDERLRNIAYQPKLLSFIESIIGEKPKLLQDMALLKPPEGGGEKPWHQDMAFGGLTYDKPVIGVWIALDEAGLDNGCMRVIPRSHMDGGQPHYPIRDWQICDTNVPIERNVSIPLKPGGALFFHGLLLHGTPYNFSTQRRRAIQLHYTSESAKKISPMEYKRIFTNEMTGAEC